MKIMALGGVDRVGSSCYYLALAGQKFLLDCGSGGYGSGVSYPSFDALLRAEENLLSLSQLDGIFLSHGHYDHVGGLTMLREQGCDAPAYATELTTVLMAALLVDQFVYRKKDSVSKQICRTLQNEKANRSIQAIPYYTPIQKGSVTVTFYPAGHTPGAAMIYLESPEGNVLYTGDFQKTGVALTQGYLLPKRVQPDVVILCGTHAQHPNYTPINNLEQNEERIRSWLSQGKSVHLKVSQLTKGLETAHWVSSKMAGVKIYLDEHTWNLAQRMEQAHTVSMSPNFYQKRSHSPAGSITIGGNCAEQGQMEICANFSLHATHGDCVELVKMLNPSVVFLVHSPADTRGVNGLQEFIRGVGEHTCVLMPESGHLYDTAS